MSPAKDNDTVSFSTPLAPPSSFTSSSNMPLSSMFTLPSFAIPQSYDIQVAFHVPMRRYRGHVETILDISSPFHAIYLNATNLELENISLEGEDGGVVVGLVAEVNTTIGVVKIDFGNSIVAGKYTLSIDFRGNIRSGLQGVYVNKYIDKHGVEKDGISTMFAATEARSFFPCWDQPDIKCPFSLKVLVPKDSEMDVLSNMNIAHLDTETNPFVVGWADCEWKKFKFAKSPSMSTYLICIVVGQYGYISKDVGSTKLKVYAPFNRIEEAKFAIETAAKCMDIFNSFFGIEYCLPKLDLIGLACLSVGIKNLL